VRLCARALPEPAPSRAAITTDVVKPMPEPTPSQAAHSPRQRRAGRIIGADNVRLDSTASLAAPEPKHNVRRSRHAKHTQIGFASRQPAPSSAPLCRRSVAPFVPVRALRFRASVCLRIPLRYIASSASSTLFVSALPRCARPRLHKHATLSLTPTLSTSFTCGRFAHKGFTPSAHFYSGLIGGSGCSYMEHSHRTRQKQSNSRSAHSRGCRFHCIHTAAIRQNQ
jgi:hypothetical protein